MFKNKNTKTVLIGNYEFSENIGRGNSALVKKARHTLTKHTVAIKLFRRESLDSDKALRLKREIDSMKRLKHSNIIRLYEVIETPILVGLVMEYAANGDLCDYIKNSSKQMSEREARSFFKQIVSAVHYCHKQNIVHRDIKIENVLLDASFNVKLADFGFSTHFDKDEKLSVWCGSPPYCAPELFLGLLYDAPKVDVWSLGVVLYILVCNRFPFDAKHNYEKLRAQVISGVYTTPFYLSEECKSLLRGMLTVNPDNRYSLDDVVNHAWFKQDNPNDDCLGLIDKIEDISINDKNNFAPDERVLLEIRRLGLDENKVIESVMNNEHDENRAVYYLIEDSLKHPSRNRMLNKASSKLALRSHARKLVDLNENETYTNTSRKTLSKINSIEETSAITTTATDDTENYNDEADANDEEMARNYLKNSIRRHTIATNPPDNQDEDVQKSSECVNQRPRKKNLFTSDLNSFAKRSRHLVESPDSLLNSISGSMDNDQMLFNHLQQTLSQSTQPAYPQPGGFYQYPPAYHEESQTCAMDEYTSANKSNPIASRIQYLTPPVPYGRRASDGGSNISLYKQFFSFRNNQALGSTASSQQSRGSITSGMPVNRLMSHAQPSIDNNDESLCSSANVIKMKKQKQRHEPYVTGEAGEGSFACRTKREQSFGAGGCNSPPERMMGHRSSEPNHLDLIQANRAHFEFLYNQKIKSELKTLQEHNPDVDVQTLNDLQMQHKNLVHNNFFQTYPGGNYAFNNGSVPTGYGLSMSCSPNDGFMMSHMGNRRKRSNANLIAESSSSSSTSSLYHSSNNLDMSDNQQLILEQSQHQAQQQQQQPNIAHPVYHANLVNRSNCLNEGFASSSSMNSASPGALGVANNSSMNNLCASTSQLQIIQEEQSDLRSASTTPRLSQTSTVSNSSYIDNGELSSSLSCSTVTMLNVNQKCGDELLEKHGLDEVPVKKKASISIHVSFDDETATENGDYEDDAYANGEQNSCEYAQSKAQFHYSCDTNATDSNNNTNSNCNSSNINNSTSNHSHTKQILLNGNGMMDEHAYLKYVDSSNSNCCNSSLISNYKYNSNSGINNNGINGPDVNHFLQDNFGMHPQALVNNANSPLYFHPSQFNAPMSHAGNIQVPFNFMHSNGNVGATLPNAASPLYETFLKYPNLFAQIPLSQSSSQ